MTGTPRLGPAEDAAVTAVHPAAAHGEVATEPSGNFAVSQLCIWRGMPGSRLAVGPLSVHAAAGSVVGIVGETGAGKTLTLRALMGLLPSGFSMSGEVQLAPGLRPVSSEAELRAELGRRIGVVLQDPFSSFDPLKTVGSQLVEGVVRSRRLTKGLAGERARELLHTMGFHSTASIMRAYPNQLSGGMAQRVAIAMALMPRPSVVLADEPTSALDASLRVEALTLLEEQTVANAAVLVLVSHDLGLVAGFCHLLVVMYAGRVVETGPTAEVMLRPRHPYTEALLACAPAVGAGGKRRLRTIPGGVASLAESWSGCRFAPRCPYAFEHCLSEEPELSTLEYDGVATACHLASGERARLG